MPDPARADWIAGEGRRLGKYQLIRRLATGGMAEIYLARTSAIEGFEKLVVLKRILPQYAENDAFIRMFLAEARLAATLHHPNVVQVYDIGEDQGAYFFAMEYVEGVDLRQLLVALRRADRGLPMQHVLHVVTGVCAGLHYAHEMKDPSGAPLGIVHRDISPSNVLVTFDGAVKVVDFGIAKAANVSTSAGTLKGKIPYMSPEQCHGRPLDRRSDVFSIGTLLWELTTGRRLFKAENELALISVVARGEVTPPSAVWPEYPKRLEEIVLEALAVDVEQRWQTAQALQLALEDYAHEAGLPLSAARFQPFLREVCAGEIAKAEALRAASTGLDLGGQVEPAGPEGVTAVYGSGDSPAATPGPESGEGATEPGDEGSGRRGTADPITSVVVAREEAPGVTRRVVGVVGGVAAALGLGAFAWVWWGQELGGRDDVAAPGGEGAAAEVVPAATEDEDPAEVPAEVAAEPSNEPSNELAPPTAAAEAEPTAPENVPAEAEPEAESAPAQAEPAEAEPAAEEPAPQARSSKSRSRSSRRSTSRPTSGKSTETAPSKESKPKWNPKAPPPPGL